MTSGGKALGGHRVRFCKSPRREALEGLGAKDNASLSQPCIMLHQVARSQKLTMKMLCFARRSPRTDPAAPNKWNGEGVGGKGCRFRGAPPDACSFGVTLFTTECEPPRSSSDQPTWCTTVARGRYACRSQPRCGASSCRNPCSSPGRKPSCYHNRPNPPPQQKL